MKHDSSYSFERDTFDLLEEEALQRADAFARSLKEGLPEHERRILRERNKTHFAYNEGLQRMFEGNVEAYCSAMEDFLSFSEFRNQLREHFGIFKELLRVQHAFCRTPKERVHSLLLAFREWASEVSQFAGPQYRGQEERGHVFRILVNVPLIPMHVAMGIEACRAEKELPHMDVARREFAQARIFTERTIESLEHVSWDRYAAQGIELFRCLDEFVIRTRRR